VAARPDSDNAALEDNVERANAGKLILNFAQEKAGLAAYLGVSADQIEIIVKA
jgi:hypothetical protein